MSLVDGMNNDVVDGVDGFLLHQDVALFVAPLLSVFLQAAGSIGVVGVMVAVTVLGLRGLEEGGGEKEGGGVDEGGEVHVERVVGLSSGWVEEAVLHDCKERTTG